MAMTMGASKGKPGRATPSMNVTPLVDVVLVLLIIFMVITPLMARQFWIHLPNQTDKDEPAVPDEEDDEHGPGDHRPEGDRMRDAVGLNL